MRTFTVFWHYVGNHGAYERWADTPEEACRQVIRGFSDDFAAKAELVAVEGAHKMRKATDWMAPTEAEIIEAGGLPVDFVLKDKMGHLIDEAVAYVTGELMADWPVRDAIKDATSERYWGRLDDEWRNSPAIPETLRDEDNVWDEFIDIVFTRADKAVRAARGAE